MGKIVKRISILGDKGESKAAVLFDSGATDSVVRKDIAEKVATFIRLPKRHTFTLADGKTEVHTSEVAIISLTINGITIDDEFYLLENLGREIILGAATMQKWDIHLHLKKERISVGINPDALELY